ncbi:hypothetical protein B7486_67090, partial [cyanobacterium TDX16]
MSSGGADGPDEAEEQDGAPGHERTLPPVVAAGLRAPARVARRAFGVVGDTRRRRRPSDALRVLTMVVLLALTLALLEGGAELDRRLAADLLPLPSPWAGAAEVAFWAAPSLAALLCLFVAVRGRRWAIGRDVVLAVLASGVVVGLVRAAFGDDGGRPDHPSLEAGSD